MSRHATLPARALLRRPLHLAIALALAATAAPALAQPAQSHWMLTVLPTLGGDSSTARGINAAGTVVGTSTTADGFSRAYSFADRTMSELGNIGGKNSDALDINDAGQVTGRAERADGVMHAFRFSGGSMIDLHPLDAGAGAGFGINAHGHVAASITTELGTRAMRFLDAGVRVAMGVPDHLGFVPTALNDAGVAVGLAGVAPGHFQPFMDDHGRMAFLAELPFDVTGGASDINAAGQVTGDSGGRAFLFDGGRMTDLGRLDGSSSAGLAINAAGRVVGSAMDANESLRAMLHTGAEMIDLNLVNGMAGQAVTLLAARDINDVGQITGTSQVNATGETRGFILRLDTTVWQDGSSGRWDDHTNWSAGIAPNRNNLTHLDPTRSLTVVGPAGQVDTKRLTIGGQPGGGNGIATLRLDGGTVNVLGNGSGDFVTVTDRGVLSGDGVLLGRVDNRGLVDARNLTLSHGLVNHGRVTGHGRLATTLDNRPGGTLMLDDGQRLRLALQGEVHQNAGLIELRGSGELVVDGLMRNAPNGRIVFNGGRAHFNGSLRNEGQLWVSFGQSHVYGIANNFAGSKIILSGNSETSFYGPLDMLDGSELRVSSGSTAVFFGAVGQGTGALFTGTGSKLFEGGFGVGASPGFGSDGGDVLFGAGNTYLAEIGGSTACTLACADDEALRNAGFDKFVVAGELTLGGTLVLASWQGFAAQAGDSFDLLDWGSLQGSFGQIDAGGLQLADGARLDFSALYTTGTVSVTAVPEPTTLALWAAGLGLLGWRWQRRAATGGGRRH